MKAISASICLALVLVLMLSTTGLNGQALAEAYQLTVEQRNAIAMLNYIIVLTQDINASKNSRLSMEEAYTSLINNTYPNAVDSRTQSQLTGLLDTMENYRMIAVKRDRLQFIYEQNQAQAIRSAVPNPLGLLSTVQSFNPIDLIASIVYMAVDSATSYKSFTAENELQYLQSGWALDDEEANVLHNSRKGTFDYMITMVRDNKLPGDLTLTENAVKALVEWKNNANVVSRIQSLESNKKTYQFYGGYWLILAESYYENGDYDRCLDSIAAYEALNTRIFRRDYEYARVLPLVIAAVKEECNDIDFVERALPYVQAILDNTEHNDWALRYYATQVFVDFYKVTNDISFLQKAYNIVLDNVNYLIDKQHALNDAYLAPIQDEPTPKDATSNEKQQIKDYNNLLKETRKKELPPIYEPLLLNCDLLFAISSELNIRAIDAKKIDGILHPNGKPVFLNRPLDALFWATQQENAENVDEDIEFAGTAIKIPVSLITSMGKIEVSIQEEDNDAPELITDWTLDAVTRDSDINISDIQAIYTSETAKRHNWKPDAQIVVSIIPRQESDTVTINAEYITVGTKKEWYDYLKFWEGHKNAWYDYLKVWDNSVNFERVK